MAKQIRKPRLATMSALADEALDLYHEARAGRVDPTDAIKLAGVLRTVAELRQASDIEGRVHDLQRRLKEREEINA